MYKPTKLLTELLEKLQSDFTLEGVSQETIDSMIKKGLIEYES